MFETGGAWGTLGESYDGRDGDERNSFLFENEVFYPSLAILYISTQNFWWLKDISKGYFFEKVSLNFIVYFKLIQHQ